MPLITRVEATKIEDGEKGLKFDERSAHYGETNTTAAVEFAPCTLNVLYLTRKKQRLRFRVELPWSYMIGTFINSALQYNCRIVFSPVPLKAMGDRVYTPAIPNIKRSGELCFGDNALPNTGTKETRLRRAFEMFWETPFNYEVWPGLRTLPAGFRRLRTYGFHEKWSLLADWQKIGRKVRWRHLSRTDRYPGFKTLGDAMNLND